MGVGMSTVAALCQRSCPTVVGRVSAALAPLAWLVRFVMLAVTRRCFVTTQPKLRPHGMASPALRRCSHGLNRFIAGLLACAASVSAFANYYCDGPVYGLSLGPGGIVTAESVAGINWPYVCGVDSVRQINTSTDACKAIYATLLSAQVSGKRVRFWFDDSLTCNTHPSWANLDGWYFGPALID